MTDQQIIETLATKVMGWELVPYGDGSEWWWKDGQELLFPNRYWNPLLSISDSWVLVDKIGPFEYRKSPIRIGGGYQHIAEFFYQGHWYSGEGKTVQEAISQAALKAVA